MIAVSRNRTMLRKAYVRLARSISPTHAVSFTFNRTVDPISGQNRIKGFINKVDRQVLGHNWDRMPKSMRTTAVGFPEHLERNCHWHTVMALPWGADTLVLLYGRKIWRCDVPTGELHISSLGSDIRWFDYITKEIHIPARVDNVLVYHPYISRRGRHKES